MSAEVSLVDLITTLGIPTAVMTYLLWDRRNKEKEERVDKKEIQIMLKELMESGNQIVLNNTVALTKLIETINNLKEKIDIK